MGRRPVPAPLADSARRERWALVGLLACYLAAAGGFAVAVPYGEVPDETAHANYVDYIVRFHALPPIGRPFYTNEAVQPPLYYSLAAGLVMGARAIAGTPRPQGHLTPTVWPNPAYSPTGALTVVLHPPEQRWMLWPIVFRALSILCGLGCVLLTYGTARVLVPPPASAAVPLVATAVAALLPQANFIRASVTNENLADLLAAWIVLLLALHLTRPYRRRRVLLLGLALGLGLLTKLSIAPLALPLLAVLWGRRAAAGRRFGPDLLGLGAITALIAGPFYLYRWIAYGDPLATQAWQVMLPNDSPWHLGDLFWLAEPFRGHLWTSFWGVYGWQRIYLPDGIYNACLVLTALAIAGGGLLLYRRALTPPQQAGCAVLLAVLGLLYGLVIVISLRLIAWQGRELFPALSAVSLLFGFGLAGLSLGPAALDPVAPLPRWRRRLAPVLLAAGPLGLLAIDLYSIVWVLGPLYN